MSATALDVLAVGDRLAGENEAVVGSNNTTVNRYFGVTGDAGPYCGYFLWYCARKAGSDIFDGCSNPAYVPTVRSFFAGRKVASGDARPGDIFAYRDQHLGFVRERVSGATVITLEGNSKVYATLAEARSSYAGTGAYEGIGYRKRVLDENYTVYRPVYAQAGGASAGTPEDNIRQWQKWLGVTADGQVGPKTLAAADRRLLLGVLEKRPLRPGDQGDGVKVLQGLLYAAGQDPNGLDGEYGPGMTAAVRRFQGEKGLEADGEAGRDTVAALLGRT